MSVVIHRDRDHDPELIERVGQLPDYWRCKRCQKEAFTMKDLDRKECE